MKAKKQKLLFKAIKWIGEQCEMGWNKEEIQDLLDEFIDHHDSKKKSKFGSDKEVVKLKEDPQEKTFEEWEQEIKEYQKVFIIGKKAKVTSSSATLKHSSNHCFSIGDIVNIDSYEYMGAHCENGTETIDNWVHFKDLEPIIETKFKVGDKVECMGAAEFGRVGFIDNATTDEGYFNVKFYTSKVNYFEGVKHYSVLKLLPND